MILPTLLLTLIGCGGSQDTVVAQEAFKTCAAQKLDRPSNSEYDTYVICGRETDYNWDVWEALAGKYLPKPQVALVDNDASAIEEE